MSSVNITSFIPKAINGTQEGAMSGMLETGIKVTAQAKEYAPVAEIGGGLLEASIMWKTKDLKGGITQGTPINEPVKDMQVVVGSATEYAVYQEYGTRKMEAQPFLRPAVDVITNGLSQEKAMAKAMEDSVRSQLRKAGKL